MENAIVVRTFHSIPLDTDRPSFLDQPHLLQHAGSRLPRDRFRNAAAQRHRKQRRDAPAHDYTPVSGPVLSEILSTFTPTFSSRVSPRFMNGVCIS